MEGKARVTAAAIMQQPMQLRATARGCHHNKPTPKPLHKNLQLLTLRAAAATGDSWSFTLEWHTLLAKYFTDVMSRRDLSLHSEHDFSTALNLLDCVRDVSLPPMKNVTL
jgi:hypothetical protein